MKRIKIILPIALLLLLAVALLRPPKAYLHAPRFVPATSQPSGPFLIESYDWVANIPFQGGKVWIFATMNRANFHEFFYDLNQRMVLGELLNSAPMLANQEQTKLLCLEYPYPVTLKNRVVGFLNQMSHWKIATNDVERYWILDLRDNSAVQVGELSKLSPAVSKWRPSPGFRYSFNVPFNNASFFLCDLEAGKFERIEFDGQPKGWWDDYQILVKDEDGNYVLFDVVTRKTSTLFSAETVARNLKELGVSENPTNLATIFNWNGHDYDFYFTGKQRGNQNWYFYPDGMGYTNSSFLIRVERAGPALKLAKAHFQFKWSGHLDAGATHYVYGGGRGDGSIVLRDLTNDTERVIVPPNNQGYYSMPQFYGETVIYERFERQTDGLHGALWRVDLNGTNATRLLPPPGNQAPEK